MCDTEKRDEYNYRFNRGITVGVVILLGLLIGSINSCELYDRHLKKVAIEKVTEMVKEGADPLEATIAAATATKDYPSSELDDLILIKGIKGK